MDDIKLLTHLIERQPQSALARISEAIGPGPAALLMRGLAGCNIYLPSKRTLFLTGLPLIIKEHTQGLAGQQRRKALKELSSVYHLPVWKLKKYGKNIG